MKILVVLSMVLLGATFNSAAFSSDTSKVTFELGQINLKSMSFNQSGIMKVSGPDGFYKVYNLEQGQSSVPLFDLGIKKDGHYKYELVLTQNTGQEIVDDPSNGRIQAVRNIVNANKVSGHFNIQHGDFVKQAEEKGSRISDKELGGRHEH